MPQLSRSEVVSRESAMAPCFKLRSPVLGVIAALLACGGTAVALFGTPPAVAKPRCTAVGVSLAVAPNPARAGNQVTVSGQLKGLRHQGSPSAQGCAPQVVLWRKLPGARRFSAIARGAAKPGGAYRIVFPAGTVTSNSEWYTTMGGLRSRTVVQTVFASVSLASTATFAIAGMFWATTW